MPTKGAPEAVWRQVFTLNFRHNILMPVFRKWIILIWTDHSKTEYSWSILYSKFLHCLLHLYIFVKQHIIWNAIVASCILQKTLWRCFLIIFNNPAWSRHLTINWLSTANLILADDSLPLNEVDPETHLHQCALNHGQLRLELLGVCVIIVMVCVRNNWKCNVYIGVDDVIHRMTKTHGLT